MILTAGINCSISPSVYVAYRNLRASDNCPSFGWGDFTRGRVYNTTIAYKPGFLSTSMCTGGPEGFYQGFAALNLTDLQYPVRRNGSCSGLDASMESTTNGPYLSMPPALTALDPDWSTCDAVYWGAFDPPIALHTATALAPDPGRKSPPTPAPGSPVAPPHAPATPTASLVDPVEPGRHPPAPKPVPQGPKQQNPNPPDPIKTPANSPRPDFQDPDPSKIDPTDPIQNPASHNNEDPVASTARANPLKGGDVAPGSSKATSNPQSSDPQRAGEVSEKDPGVDPGNANKAGSALDPANKVNQSPLPSIGGHQIQAAKGGGIILASTTLQPGLQTTIDGTPLSVDKSHVIVASSTIPLAPPPADPIITLINGDTITAGGQAAIVSGTTVALAANDALVVNGKTSPLPPPPTPTLTVAGQTLTPAPTGFAIGRQSVLPGGPAVTVDGSTFSLASESNALIVNGKTSPVPQPPPTPILTLAGQTITPASTGFAIGGQSVLPGGPAVIFDGSTFSLASSENNALIINGKSTPLPPTPILTVAGQTLTPAPTGFAIGGQSVLPGGPAVIVDGSTFSLASPGSNALIVNGKTTPLPSAPNSVFKVGSQTFTAAPTGFNVGTQSVSPGAPAVMVDGTLISLDDSSELIIGTSTVPLGSATQTTQDAALRSLIMYSVGGVAATSTTGSSNTSNVTPFLGGSARLRVGFGTALCVFSTSFIILGFL